MLPVEKFGSLVLKTICKPVASRLKKAAGKHPRFREYIITIAQKNHRFTTTVQSRIYGHAPDVAIQPLNKEEAVQAAADLLGEIFVFSVAGAAIIFGVQRSARSEARKEELRKQELEAIKQKEENLEKELEFTRGKLAELEHLAMAPGLSGFSTSETLIAQKTPNQDQKFIRTLMASQQPMLVQPKIPSSHHLHILLKRPSKMLHLVIEILIPENYFFTVLI
ncbi:hypothetical protein MKX01_032936 [Papaver californicum]|nr:hypothetical protein MKX01_032936 [Papaver californicum]